jgi:hypothetical protein
MTAGSELVAEPADPIAGLVALLLADAGVAALAGVRVFGGELPKAEAQFMPRAALVVAPSGGDFAHRRILRRARHRPRRPVRLWRDPARSHLAARFRRDRDAAHQTRGLGQRPHSLGAAGRRRDGRARPGARLAARLPVIPGLSRSRGGNTMTPYEIIGSPLSLWLAPLGTVFPLIDVAPAVAWKLIGTNGTANQDDRRRRHAQPEGRGARPAAAPARSRRGRPKRTS